MSCGGELPPLPTLRHREPARRQVLHGVRRRARSRRPRGTAPRPAAAEAPPEERRQATVLFADLSGYTAAAERMDPEAVKALVDRTLRRLGEEIERFGGTIDKFIGDNVMGVFGAPVAHEDDPERAVRAGPRRCRPRWRRSTARSEERYGVSFSLRVGINSGEVMAGRRRRPLHGDGRRGQRRRPPAGGGPAEQRHRRRVAPTAPPASRSPTSASSPCTLKGKEEPVPAWEATGDAGRPRAAARCAARRR